MMLPLLSLFLLLLLLLLLLLSLLLLFSVIVVMVVMLVGDDDAEEDRGGEGEGEAVASHTRLEVVSISTLLIVSFPFLTGSTDAFTVSSFFRRATVDFFIPLILDGDGAGEVEGKGKGRFAAWRVGEGGSVFEECVVLDKDHLRLEHTVGLGVGLARAAFTNLNINIRLVPKRKEGPSD